MFWRKKHYWVKVYSIQTRQPDRADVVETLADPKAYMVANFGKPLSGKHPRVYADHYERMQFVLARAIDFRFVKLPLKRQGAFDTRHETFELQAKFLDRVAVEYRLYHEDDDWCAAFD